MQVSMAQIPLTNDIKFDEQQMEITNDLGIPLVVKMVINHTLPMVIHREIF